MRRDDESRGGRCWIKEYDGCQIATKEGRKREEMEIEDKESSSEGTLNRGGVMSNRERVSERR